MTKDEALDLALEALDIVKIHFTQNRHVNEAITAIKQARSAPVQEPVGVFREDDDIGYVDLMPHQQIKLKDGDLVYTTPPAQPAPVQEQIVALIDENQRLRAELKFNTPPAAQRQWVGLTDEEVSQLIGGMPHGKMVRAIEAKLREKNT